MEVGEGEGDKVDERGERGGCFGESGEVSWGGEERDFVAFGS